jgi:hypothetical protein
MGSYSSDQQADNLLRSLGGGAMNLPSTSNGQGHLEQVIPPARLDSIARRCRTVVFGVTVAFMVADNAMKSAQMHIMFGVMKQ